MRSTGAKPSFCPQATHILRTHRHIQTNTDTHTNIFGFCLYQANLSGSARLDLAIVAYLPATPATSRGPRAYQRPKRAAAYSCYPTEHIFPYSFSAANRQPQRTTPPLGKGGPIPQLDPNPTPPNALTQAGRPSNSPAAAERAQQVASSSKGRHTVLYGGTAVCS